MKKSIILIMVIVIILILVRCSSNEYEEKASQNNQIDAMEFEKQLDNINDMDDIEGLASNSLMLQSAEKSILDFHQETKNIDQNFKSVDSVKKVEGLDMDLVLAMIDESNEFILNNFIVNSLPYSADWNNSVYFNENGDRIEELEKWSVVNNGTVQTEEELIDYLRQYYTDAVVDEFILHYFTRDITLDSANLVYEGHLFTNSNFMEPSINGQVIVNQYAGRIIEFDELKSEAVIEVATISNVSRAVEGKETYEYQVETEFYKYIMKKIDGIWKIDSLRENFTQ